MHRANSTRSRTRRSDLPARRRGWASLPALLALGAALGVLPGQGAPPAHADENMGICQPAGGLPVLPPASGTGSQRANPAGAGFVFDPGCDDPAGRLESAPPWGRYSSAGSVDTVEHLATGSYAVWFAGLGAGAGVPQVSAVGATPNRCRIGTWGADGFDQLVTVLCVDAHGVPIDWEFTAQFTTERTRYAVFGYLQADQPTNGQAYQPTDQYSWNGTPITVQRTGTGRYTVTRAESGTEPGADLVSAYGTGTAGSPAPACKLTGSTSSAAYVSCFTGTAAADSPFTLTYGEQGNLLGLPDAGQSAGGLPSGYAWIDTTTGTTPDPGRRFASKDPGTGAGWSQSFDPATGIATVAMPLGMADGVPQVVADGPDGSFCSVAGDWTTGSIPVMCWDGSGARVQEPFEVTFTGLG